MKNIKKVIIDFIFIILGASLMAFSVTAILLPNQLSTGGITGLSKIIQDIISVDYATIFYILAIVVLVICWITLGWHEAKKIILMTIIFPTVLMVFQHIDFYLLEKKDMFLAAIYFGVLHGIGMGLLFKRGFSFGGTDTIAKIIHKKILPFVSVSQILMFIDAIIIIFSGIIFGRNIAMYALVAQLVLTKTINFVLYGLGSQKIKIEIISTFYKDIEDYIINNIERGVSKHEIMGGYTGEKKIMISTICSPRESMLIKSFIAKTDMNAFVTVQPINSVWGKGLGFDSLVEE